MIILGAMLIGGIVVGALMEQALCNGPCYDPREEYFKSKSLTNYWF